MVRRLLKICVYVVIAWMDNFQPSTWRWKVKSVKHPLLSFLEFTEQWMSVLSQLHIPDSSNGAHFIFKNSWNLRLTTMNIMLTTFSYRTSWEITSYSSLAITRCTTDLVLRCHMTSINCSTLPNMLIIAYGKNKAYYHMEIMAMLTTNVFLWCTYLSPWKPRICAMINMFPMSHMYSDQYCFMHYVPYMPSPQQHTTPVASRSSPHTYLHRTARSFWLDTNNYTIKSHKCRMVNSIPVATKSYFTNSTWGN